MSFDIYFGIFKNGEDARLARAAVADAFAPFVSAREPNLLQVRFADGGWSDVYVADADEIDGFSVNRPPGAPAFWNIMFELLKNPGTVLYWADGGAVVASPAAIRELPADLVEALGTPAVVTSGEDIVSRIAAS